MPDSDITWAVYDIKNRAVDIGKYRDYYNGDHLLPWATTKWNVRFRDVFERLRDNLCPAVVDAKADRIQLTSIQGPEDPETRNDDTAPPSPLDVAIQRIWTRENLERRQGEITKSALKDGDAFVIIWPDATNQARWYIQRGDRMAVRYREEPQGDIELAAKMWPVDTYNPDKTKWLWRLNLYYATTIERYITLKEYPESEVPRKVASWTPYDPAPDEEGDSDVAPGVGGPIIDNPFNRVPVFPFPNNADTGAYGQSDLKDIIPIQDALNKSIANMVVAGEFLSWPQRVLIGVEVDVDENGDPTGKEQKHALDRILAIGNPSAKVAEWTAADLGNFIKEQDSYRAEMARISRTPLHYMLLNGDFPSGEAMDAAEAPLLTLVNDRILAWRPAYETAMGFSLEIEKTDFEPGSLNAVFAPTRRMSATQQAEEWRVKKELGVPEEQLWREMGYDSTQIEEFKMEKDTRMAFAQAAFDGGSPAAGPSPEGTVGTGADNLV